MKAQKIKVKEKLENIDFGGKEMSMKILKAICLLSFSSASFLLASNYLTSASYSKMLVLGLIAGCVTLHFVIRLLDHFSTVELEQSLLLKKALEENHNLSRQLAENEKSIQLRTAKLKQANLGLEEFAYLAAHDLKAPIRNIGSFSQLILRKNKDKFDESTLANFNFIIKNSKQAQNLINGLLNYSTANKDIEETKEFSLTDAANMAMQNLAATIEDKNVTLDFSEDMPFVKANLSSVVEVLSRLLNNAITYNTSTQPTVTIGTGKSATKGNFFYVADNGIGIPEAQQEKVFKVFNRLHGQQEYPGSGIGLSYCKKVIEAYNGEIWLESNEGEGTVVFFTLPAVTKSELAV